MFWTFFVLAYVGIAVLSIVMTVKEHQAGNPHDLVGLIAGGLACLFWPVAAVLLFLAVSLRADTADQAQHTI